MIVNPINFKHIKSLKTDEEKDEQLDEESDEKSDFIGVNCDFCYETYDIVLDEVHGEIFCKNCGFIISDNIII